jgi:large subunit ribosomal protein L6
MPIDVPGGVQVTIGDDNAVTVKGARGQLTRSFNRDMRITQEDKRLLVERPGDDRVHRSMHGLTRTLLANMVLGVSTGFERVLEVSGVGYRVQKTGDGLSFQVGFSSAVDYHLPAGIDAAVEGNNRVRLSGFDKELLGQVAASVRAIRPCDHYKGKGIKYLGEKVRIKPGKAGKVTKG